jgi:hypothetical protein
MARKLSASLDDHRKMMAEGDSYLPFLFGSPQVKGQTDTLTEQERKTFGENWRLTSYSAHGDVRPLVLESLTGSPMEWENEQPQLPPDATTEQKERAELRRRIFRQREQLARVIYKEFDLHKHKRLAIDDAMTYGMGCFDTYKDANKGLCGFRYCSIRRVLIDTETEHDPVGESMMWRSKSYTMTLADAKHWATKVWKITYKFQPEQLETDPENDKKPTKMVRIRYVYLRGGSPALDTGRMDKEGAEVGKDAVYTGKPRCLVFEECFGPTMEGELESTFKYLAEMDYPYPLDIGHFPLTLFGINPSSEGFWHPPIYRKSHSLQVSLNWALRYINTDAWLSAKRVIAYLSSALSKDQLEKVLKDPANLLTVEVKDKQAWQEFWKTLDFGKSNPALKEVLAIARDLYDHSSNKELFSGRATTGRESATRAAISSERMNLVVGSMADAVDAALTEAMRKAIMACRHTMTAEQVAKWVGDEYMYWETDPVTGKQVSPVWKENPTIEELRLESDINIKPRSTRIVNPEQRRLDMEFILAKSSEWVGKVIQANQVNPVLAREVARVGNEAMRAFGRLLALPYADALVIDLAAASSQPIMQGPAGGGGAAAPGGGGVPPDPAAAALGNALDQLDMENTGQGALAQQVSGATGGGYG